MPRQLVLAKLMTGEMMRELSLVICAEDGLVFNRAKFNFIV